MADWSGELHAAELRAARRAQWLADLAEAVEQAQLLLWDLAAADDVSPEARELYGDLESVRVEIDSLRGVGGGDDSDDQLDQWLRLWTQPDPGPRAA
ncbi:hypothetical protein [Sphingomonas sp.]|uniref:hypothetical protein n=1 Tax=Sphingomonas sp. TaxID=28214 RepID=UPI00286E9C46|nr:hypothetical protein [Sphingomonas sp.]